MHDLPTPDQILEELADKTAAQIDRRAIVAFDGAFREIIRYHRFLLALNSSSTPDGQPFNFAEVPGSGWQAPHRDWIRLYARLFERAADAIPDEDHFIRTLAYAPIYLLAGSSSSGLSPNIIRAILDLGPMLMHRIESWVTKRTTVEIAEGETAKPRLALAGSDARAYANVLPALVGAWESLLKRVPSVYKWRENSEYTDTEVWLAFRTSWPFLWQHLSNAAHCLTVAVWNEDESGAALFREALVRWPHTLGQLDRAELRWRRLLFPGTLSLDWSEASAHVAPLSYEHWRMATPSELFGSVLQGAHDDVVLLTAALLLSWTINDKQASDIGARTARSLLRREDADEENHRTSARELDLKSLFLDTLRIEIAGERFGEGSYGTDLDSLVQALDNMTERRVVPGRVFTPSTMHERDDLLLAFVTILAASSPNEGDGGIVQLVAELTENEDVLPSGDRTLRNVLDELNRFRRVLEQSRVEIGHGVALLAPERKIEQVTTRLYDIVGSAQAAIEAKRTERLKERPVDAAKLERIRLAIESALLDKPLEAPFFRGVQIQRVTRDSLADWQEAILGGIEKAQLVEPTMASPISNFEEYLVSNAQHAAGRRAWAAFSRRPRTQLDVAATVDEEAFWREVAALVEQTGPEPVLVVSQTAGLRAWRRSQSRGQENQSSLRIEQLPRDERGGWYIATIEGVDVFEANFTSGVSWLFSARALNNIGYAELDRPGHFVDVAFELKEELKGVLRVRFRQCFDWSDLPTFELRSPVLEEPVDRMD